MDPTARIFIPWNLSIGDWSAVGAMAELYNLGPLQIGAQVTISQRAHLCGGTHDLSSADLPLVKSTIAVGSGAWICADAFVGPGVRIGSMAVVGARAVAIKNVENRAIVAGNPAAIIGLRPPTGEAGPGSPSGGDEAATPPREPKEPPATGSKNPE